MENIECIRGGCDSSDTSYMTFTKCEWTQWAHAFLAPFRFHPDRRAPGVIIIPAAQINNITLGGGHTHIPTQGDISVTLTGRRLGPTSNDAIRVTYGTKGTEYTAKNCTCTRAELEIVCMAVPGAGHTHKWRVTVEGGV